jgi:hypothetical protein
MRIDSSGNVGIGTSSPAYRLQVQFDAAVIAGTCNILMSAEGGVQGSLGTTTNHNLLFKTNNTEKMRIDSSGNLLVGTTTVVNSARVTIANFGSGIANGIGMVSSNTSAVDAIVFNNPNGVVGSIGVSGTTTSYNVTSDVRLKHDIVDAPEASSLIDALQVRSFKWNADDSEQRYGFIAQELLEVAPEAVNQPEDPDATMGVDYSKLVPMLVKELQSVRARLAELEGK